MHRNALRVISLEVKSKQDNVVHTKLDLIMIDFLVINATFINISAISWRPFLVVEEAGAPGENHRPWANNCRGGSREGAHPARAPPKIGKKYDFFV